MLNMEGVAPLNLVMEQIDATLKDIEEAVRAFLEDHEETQSLGYAKELLGQLRGVFHMIEFKETLLLTSDLQVALALAQSLKDDESQEPLFVAIGQSLFVLSHYLTFVHARQRSLPVLLVPTINELRKHLGLGLVSEFDFSQLDIPMTQLRETPTIRGEVLTDLAKIPLRARRLRHMYQVGLLGVIKEQNLETHLSMMMRAIERLAVLTGDVPLAQLWWISNAVLEAFVVGKVRLTTARKVVLSKIDRQIKRLVFDGLPFVNERMPTDLLKECLYLVTLSNTSSECIDDVKKSFGIHSVGVSDETLKAESELMNGPSGSVISTVAAHMCEELSHIKDLLDDAARGTALGHSQLEELVDVLSKISLSMSMLGAFKASTALREQVEWVKKLMDSVATEQEVNYVQLADTVLLAEQALKVLVSEYSLTLPDASTMDGQLSTEEEESIEFSLVEEAHVMVVSEARLDLVGVKKQVNQYIDSQFDASQLQSIPDALHGISGALNFLKLTRAASVARGCRAYVQESLIYKDSGKKPTNFEIETLADALSSLDYYLESIEEHKFVGSGTLEVAEESIAELGYAVPGADAA